MENIYRELGMHIVYMGSRATRCACCIMSHISHITSFALANTVLEKEREEDAISNLRVAVLKARCGGKSSPAMWHLFLCRIAKCT